MGSFCPRCVRRHTCLQGAWRKSREVRRASRCACVCASVHARVCAYGHSCFQPHAGPGGGTPGREFDADTWVLGWGRPLELWSKGNLLCGQRGLPDTEVRVRGTLVHLGRQPHRVHSWLRWAHGQLGVDAGPGFLLLSQGQAREEPLARLAGGSGLLPYEPADGLVSHSLLPVAGLL